MRELVCTKVEESPKNMMPLRMPLAPQAAVKSAGVLDACVHAAGTWCANLVCTKAVTPPKDKKPVSIPLAPDERA